LNEHAGQGKGKTCTLKHAEGMTMSRMAGKAGEAPDGSKRQAGRSTPPNKRLWSAGIKTISTFPPGGIFAERAEKIAETMARPEVSPGGLGGAIRMVTYFANRAGRNLPKERLAELERAKRLLRDRKAAAPVTPPEKRAAGRYRHTVLGPVLVQRHGRAWTMRRGADQPPIALGPDGWQYLERA
jgi:hypothetical protein